MFNQATVGKEELEILKSRLPKGYAAKVKEYLPRSKRNVSSQYLGQVLSGSKSDFTVLEALITLAEKHEEYVKELAERAKGAVVNEGAE